MPGFLLLCVLGFASEEDGCEFGVEGFELPWGHPDHERGEGIELIWFVDARDDRVRDEERDDRGRDLGDVERVGVEIVECLRDEHHREPRAERGERGVEHGLAETDHR